MTLIAADNQKHGASHSRQQHRGLTAAEVDASRRKHGDNVINPPTPTPWWKLYLEKFNDPVIRILMIAAVIAIAVGAAHGEYVEGVGIIIAILLATGLAFVNEHKAAREFEIRRQKEDETPIEVIRDGNYTTIPQRDVVVGDVVLIDPRRPIPADGSVTEAVSLQVSEASLTGESVPVPKFATGFTEAAKAGKHAYPQDRVLRGTSVADGHGVLHITEVGNATEIGKVTIESQEETGEITPLNRQLEKLSKWIGVVGFSIAAITFVALVAREVATGKVVLTGQQWAFGVLLGISVMIALAKVWMPIIGDAKELILGGGDAEEDDSPEADLDLAIKGIEQRRREAEEAEREEAAERRQELRGWLLTIGAGAAVFAVGAGLGVATGLLPRSPGEWLPEGFGTVLLRFFMIAVTIIVVAVPEGLAMSVTLSLAYSMRKMTAMNNLVRQMHACETIGAATVICSDKTGTLTLNQMRVQEVHGPGLAEAATAPAGAGTGGAVAAGAAPGATGGSLAYRLLVEGKAANGTAHVDRTPGKPAAGVGNPTEAALLLWLEHRGIDYIPHRQAFTIKAQLPFSTERKYMATLGRSAVTGGTLLHVKGSPQMILSRCTRIVTAGGTQEPIEPHVAAIDAALRQSQSQAMRTIALAYREVLETEGTDIEQLATGLTWIGFVTIADPVRPEVPDAIRACRAAGIQVKIVTGDVAGTAEEIGRQIGLLDANDTQGARMSGAEWGALDDEGAKRESDRIKVLSQAKPEHKMRLVKSLRARGHVVAVTGDGVNDSSALNHAHVGLAMGSGAPAAKDASDIILLDDSFASIVKGVMWGRSLYQNIQRFILFQLTINVVALIIAMIGPFIGVQIPLTVIQMLWINLIMDTFAALALATEPPDPTVLNRPPRKWTDFIVTPPMARGIFGVGGVFVVFLLAFLLYIQRTPAPAGAAIAEGGNENVTRYEISVFYTTFVLLQFWNLFNARRLGSNKSALTGVAENPLFLSIAAAILFGQIIITQFGGTVFSTVPLSVRDWLLILVGTSVVLWAGEAWRFARRAAGKTGAADPPAASPMGDRPIG